MFAQPSAVRPQSPRINADPVVDLNSASDNSLSDIKPAQKVLGFLRKRSGAALSTTNSTSITGRDRAKTIVTAPLSLATGTSRESSALPSPTLNASLGSSGPNPLKDMIRRKSSELGRLLEGGGAITKRSNDGSRASTGLELASPAAHDVDSARMVSTTPKASRSVSSPQPRTNRRPAFTLGLPWRPQSEYSSNGTSGLQARLTKSQRKFVRAFPELADLVVVPSAYCAPCLATPPQTPTDGASTPRSASLSPSDTLNTLTSSGSATSSLASACPGHFNDFACALEREILWQGTLYVTATHVCFYGKHFRTTVRVMVDYQDLVSIEKEKKMGVFPSSIRMRVRKTEGERKIGMDESEGDVATLGSTMMATKDYVLTSLMSREQAFAEIEKNWVIHGQVMKSLSVTGMGSPRMESCGTGSDTGEVLGVELESRGRNGSVKDRRMSPRTYSVISDEAFSSTENVDRGLHERLPTNGTRTTSSVAKEPTQCSRSAAMDGLLRKGSLSSSESRRGSIASAESSEKQEPTTKLKGFLKRRQSQLRRKAVSGSESCPEASLGPQEVIANVGSDDAYHHTTFSSAEPSISSRTSVLRSSTPPPTLISPSLTTTKVSHSSSTVQSVAQAGSIQGMTKHIHKESKEALSDKFKEGDKKLRQSDVGVRTGSEESDQRALEFQPSKAPTVVLPDGPVSCDCERHYKNAVITAVIPLPVKLCFEILFSGKGAGMDDKLGCDTHRIKDGSTEIKIMPWQHVPKDQSAMNPKAVDWENMSRHLEYSVSFKVPMLAKTSTACYEVQQVTRYSDFVILVHSESRTPNVPYGDHFSTVNQICMTWEAPEKTKIHCSTEVRFKKSIMWSSKVESGSLEGSGGFYKEFVRQLQEIAETQREQLIQSSICMNPSTPLMVAPSRTMRVETAAHVTPQPSSASTASLYVPKIVQDKVSITAKGAALDITADSDRESMSKVDQVIMDAQARQDSGSETSEMSRAQSLLSQQILRNTNNSIAQSKGARLSLDSARPHPEATSALGVKDQLTPKFPSERKSALSVFMQSLTPPGFPVVTVATAALPMDSKDSLTVDGQDKKDDDAAGMIPLPSIIALPWTDVVRKGLTILGKGTLYSSIATIKSTSVTPNDSTTESSKAENAANTTSQASTSTSTKTRVLMALDGLPSNLRSEDQSGGTRVKFAAPKTPKSSLRSHDGNNGLNLSTSSPSSSACSPNLCTPSSTSNSHHQKQGQSQLERRGLQLGSFSKTLLGFVALGMAISAVNTWYLFNVVSSMIDVVQLNHDHLLRQFHQHHHHHHHHNQQRPSSEVHRQPSRVWYDKNRLWSNLHSDSSIQRPSSSSDLPFVVPQSPLSPSFLEPSSFYLATDESGQHTATARQNGPTAVDEDSLVPLRTETEILKAEIVELFSLLEQARKELRQQQQRTV
ncbi:hypothetical protein BGX28_006809 [Mortierella sp. GBA30]|nr:hypothetical protein BGX28_006809 [Mortierella sp. GBA30]